MSGITTRSAPWSPTPHDHPPEPGSPLPARTATPHHTAKRLRFFLAPPHSAGGSRLRFCSACLRRCRAVAPDGSGGCPISKAATSNWGTFTRLQGLLECATGVEKRTKLRPFSHRCFCNLLVLL